MIQQAGDVVLQSVKGLRRIHEEMLKLTEHQRDGLPYNSGASLTKSDFEAMKTIIDSKADSDFWRPADQNRRCALENALKRAREVYSEDLETFLDGTSERKIELTEYIKPTVSQAYQASFGYSGDIEYFIEDCLFHNEDFVDSKGDDLFRDLGECYIRSYITMETRTVLNTPSHPHITIFSIQPHRASSQKELLCTEFWTLYYWAKNFGPRTSGQHLPMRLFSLCGYEARVLSAVFTLQPARPTAKEPRQGEDQDVKCRIHIATYRDITTLQPFLDFMAELISTPLGKHGTTHYE